MGVEIWTIAWQVLKKIKVDSHVATVSCHEQCGMARCPA